IYQNEPGRPESCGAKQAPAGPASPNIQPIPPREDRMMAQDTQIIEVEELERLVADPETRSSQYSRLTVDYYRLVTETYLAGWGASHHFALFGDGQTLAEATVSTESGLAERGNFRPGMKVLDVGCGVGGPALNIAGCSGAHVTGLDLVPERVKIAQ